MSGDSNREELLRHLAEARAVVDALRSHQVDGVVAESGVSLVQLQEAAQTLHSTEAPLRQLIESNLVGVVVAERERILEANTAFLDLVDRTPDELADGAIDWQALTPDEYQQLGEQAMKDLLATGRSAPFEKEFFRKDGTRVSVLIGAALLSREPFQWVAFVMDMTGQKRAEEQLRRLNATLEEEVERRTLEAERRTVLLQRLAGQLTDAEDRERQRIAALLHDDLQQHLAGLKFSLATLFQPGSNATKESITSLGEKIDECVRKTRELSHELSPAALAQRGLLVSFRWLAGHMEESYGLDVEVHGNDDLLRVEPHIATVLFRSVRELLFNVHKHSQSSEAQIHTSIAEEMVRVTVKDEGQGFDPEILNDVTPESGLGLFGLQERILSMGGSVEIRSNPGDGTEVTISLPLSKPAPGKEADIGLEAGRRSLSVTVLLADDHEVMRRGLSSLISQQPTLEVVGEVATGREAIAAVREKRPDVVIMDVSMPEMDGIEATREIVRIYPETRVVGLSMYEDTETRARMLEAGAAHFFAKTDPPESLVALLVGTVERERP